MKRYGCVVFKCLIYRLLMCCWACLNKFLENIYKAYDVYIAKLLAGVNCNMQQKEIKLSYFCMELNFCLVENIFVFNLYKVQ